MSLKSRERATLASIDLTIRGAGIFGLAIAWEALGRGARVRVVDPNGVASGASGGIVGALQPHTPDGWNAKKAFQRDALLAAPEFWAGVEAASGQATGFRPAGRLQPLADERAVTLARAREAAALENWGDAFSWRVIPSTEMTSWKPPSPTGLLIHDTLSALIHPRRATKSLAAAVTAKEGEIAAHAPDEGTVIHATGWAGLLELTEALGHPVGNGVKGQAALLEFDAGDMPQIFAATLHIVPHDDRTVAIGSTSEREFTDPHNTDRLLDDVVERARKLVPALTDADVIERWAGVRPRAATRAPLLGHWPDRPGHIVANGGFKIGFGIAPMVARTICDLALEGREAFPSEFRL